MRQRILLVTVDRNLSSIYKTALVNDGYDVSRAYNEDDAIACVAKTRGQFDLIIMDHDPALINGILATMEMRRIDPCAKVLLLGKNRRTKEFARQCGAFKVIKRPHTIGRFLWTAESCVQTNGPKLDEGGERASETFFHKTNGRNSIKSPQNGMEQNRKRSSIGEIGSVVGPFPPHEQSRPKHRERRLRSNRNIASAIFLVLLFGALLGNSWTTEASTPNTSMIVIDVHATHFMETKNFDLFFNSDLRFSGITGEGTYVHLLLEYFWNSTDSAILNIFAFSDSGAAQSRWAGSLNVSNGGTFYVSIHL
jgi:CheY-like chemotaxis protein